MKIIYYIGFVLLSIATLGAVDINIKSSNGQHLIRTGWLNFIKENYYGDEDDDTSVWTDDTSILEI